MKQETTLAMKAPILKNWRSNIINENLCDTADQTSSTSYAI